jgi:hypothetical protein
MNLFLQDCDLMRPQLQFTLKLENNNILNCVGLSISRKNMEMEFHVYRKCAYSDVIFPFNSFYPVEHKLATLRFLNSRLKTYRLRNEVIKQEVLYVQNNLYNISFPTQLINKFLDKHNNSTNTIHDNKDIESQKNCYYLFLW